LPAWQLALPSSGPSPFYIIVTEFRVGTRAELPPLDAKIRVAQSSARTDNDKKINPETQGELEWQMVEHS
jgi:hypothetical protein